MNKKKIVAIIVALLLLAAGARIFSDEASEKSNGLNKYGGDIEVDRNAIPTDQDVEVHSKADVAVASKAISQTLPPSNTPVAGIFQELSVRAMRGDANAACRLSADLTICAVRQLNVAAADFVTNAMVSGGAIDGDRSLDQMSSIFAAAERQAEMCADVSPSMLGHAYELQKRAAQVAPQRYSRWMASNPSLDRQNFLRQIDSWKDYRIFADAYFRRLLAERNLEDLPLLLKVYAPDSVLGVRPPFQIDDVSVFLALYQVAVSHKMQVPSDLDRAAKRLLLSKEFDIDEAAVRYGWKGTAPIEIQAAVNRQMYPNINASSFCGD